MRTFRSGGFHHVFLKGIHPTRWHDGGFHSYVISDQGVGTIEFRHLKKLKLNSPLLGLLPTQLTFELTDVEVHPQAALIASLAWQNCGMDPNFKSQSCRSLAFLRSFEQAYYIILHILHVYSAGFFSHGNLWFFSHGKSSENRRSFLFDLFDEELICSTEKDPRLHPFHNHHIIHMGLSKNYI